MRRFQRLYLTTALGLGAASGCGPFSSAVTGKTMGAPSFSATSPSSAGGAQAVPTRGVTYLAPAAAATLPGTTTVLSGPSAARAVVTGDPIRYRLRLAGNPVDPEGARRCYSGCRTARTEELLLKCLADCPGFEVEHGVTCSSEEGPPRSVCVTHRAVILTTEPDPGLLLVAVVADFALYVGLAAACDLSSTACAPVWW
jgi:hypothetical protein